MTTATPIDAAGLTARLDPGDRAILCTLWEARADSERGVGAVFAQLAGELAEVGAPAEIVALARAAIADEQRHAAVCSELASVYRGSAIAAPEVAPVRLPDYAEPVPRLRAALHAINLCCIGETVASAFVEACVAECEEPTLRDLHGKHLSDEVRHARVGWAYVASLTADERTAIAGHLPALLAAQHAAWTGRIAELPEHGMPGHGYPARATLLATVTEAIRELVLPGFDYVGLDTTAARGWFAAHDA